MLVNGTIKKMQIFSSGIDVQCKLACRLVSKMMFHQQFRLAKAKECLVIPDASAKNSNTQDKKVTFPLYN